MATLACLHHLDEAFLGLAERPLRDAGLTLDERSVLNGGALPGLGEVDGILSFGGSRSATDLDREPVLRAEAELLRDAVAAGVPVLGVCLGGQLLARSQGGQVRRASRRTVAWIELEATAAAAGDPVAAELGSPLRGLHWNEDCFDLPPGATELLRGDGPGVAAFRAGKCGWGFQFHPEVDGPALDGWYRRYGAWLGEAGVSHAQARAADERYLPDQRLLAERLFGSFARVVARHAARPARSG